MLPFSNDQGAGIHVTYQEMVEKAMKGTMADESRCNGATDEENYPFFLLLSGSCVSYPECSGDTSYAC